MENDDIIKIHETQLCNFVRGYRNSQIEITLRLLNDEYDIADIQYITELNEYEILEIKVNLKAYRQGLNDFQKETVLKMLKDNMDVWAIKKYTGMRVPEIRKIYKLHFNKQPIKNKGLKKKAD